MKRGAPRWHVQVGAYAALALAVAVVLYPVLLVLKKAFEPGRQFALSASPVPSDLTLDHFRDLVTTRGAGDELLFLRHLGNSALVALATTVVGVGLACTAGYALSRFRFPGRRLGLTGFLVVQMFPATMLLMPLYVLLDRLGLLGSVGGLVLVYATTAIPFCVWTLKGTFDAIPAELEEAARIDGATPWQIFWRIALPLARPGIAVTALFSFMTAWNEFIMASTFMTDETQYTLPVLLQSSVSQFSADWGRFAAGAIVTSLPVMVLFYVLQRYLVGGLAAGSVKG
ncbi:MAG: sugar ABC transporter permease [Kofleriaceae bacterium]|nr:sugar ABC transporter permease [Kofleriaceae bacterium]MBP6839434.1 sugar ABC transporter permease [Kofleriaceae bacterium]MBP9204266.1 sugar ABC transporter permease [Kofleriaceae bacterium]